MGAIPLIAAGAGLAQGLIGGINQSNATKTAQQQFEEQLALERANQAQGFAQQNEATNQGRANTSALAPGRLAILQAMYAKAGVPMPASMATTPTYTTTSSAAQSQLAQMADGIQKSQAIIDNALKTGKTESGQWILPDHSTDPNRLKADGYIQSIQRAIDKQKLDAQQLYGQVGQTAQVAPKAPAGPPTPTPGAPPPASPPAAAGPSGVNPTPPPMPAASVAPPPMKPQAPVTGGPGGAGPAVSSAPPMPGGDPTTMAARQQDLLRRAAMARAGGQITPPGLAYQREGTEMSAPIQPLAPLGAGGPASAQSTTAADDAAKKKAAAAAAAAQPSGGAAPAPSASSAPAAAAPPPTFAQLQAAGQARPAPPAAAPAPAPDPNSGANVVSVPTAAPPAPGATPDLQGLLTSMVANPSGYSSADVQKFYNTGAQTIDDQTTQQLALLKEDMARRGLSDSSISGGRQADLIQSTKTAKEALAESLGQQYATSLASAQQGAAGAATASAAQQAQEKQAADALATQQGEFATTTAQQAQQFAASLGLSQAQLAQSGGQFTAAQTQQAQEFAANLGVTKDQLAQAASQFQVTSGQSQQQIDAQKNQFAQSIGITKEQLDAQLAQFQQQFGLNTEQFAWQKYIDTLNASNNTNVATPDQSGSGSGLTPDQLAALGLGG